MATLISSSSSSFILQPLKPSKPSVISDPKFLPWTIISTSQPKTATRNAQKSNSRPRKRSSYGTSRRSILKKTFSQEQVTFSAPLSGDPHVGIIGGGMAGLACALSLDQKGVKSTVFDTVSQSFCLVLFCFVLFWGEKSVYLIGVLKLSN